LIVHFIHVGVVLQIGSALECTLIPPIVPFVHNTPVGPMKG